MESMLQGREQRGFEQRRHHAGESGADEPVARDERDAEAAVDEKRGAQNQDRCIVVARRDKQSLCRAGGGARQQPDREDHHDRPGTDEIGAEQHEQRFAKGNEDNGEDQRGEERQETAAAEFLSQAVTVATHGLWQNGTRPPPPPRSG